MPRKKPTKTCEIDEVKICRLFPVKRTPIMPKILDLTEIQQNKHF